MNRPGPDQLLTAAYTTFWKQEFSEWQWGRLADNWQPVRRWWFRCWRVLGVRGALAASTSILTVDHVLRVLGLKRDRALSIAHRLLAEAGNDQGAGHVRDLSACRAIRQPQP